MPKLNPCLFPDRDPDPEEHPGRAGVPEVEAEGASDVAEGRVGGDLEVDGDGREVAQRHRRGHRLRHDQVGCLLGFSMGQVSKALACFFKAAF